MKPKLKVDGLGWEPSEKLLDFEQARYFPFDSRDLLIVAEGTVIKSFDELVEMTQKPDIKDKTVLKIGFFPMIVGG